MAEVVAGTFETFDHFAVFREFAKDGMMEVHGISSPFFCSFHNGERTRAVTAQISPVLKGLCDLFGEEADTARTGLSDTRLSRLASRSFASDLNLLRVSR